MPRMAGNTLNTARLQTHIMVKPKSRLDYLQATDWETILVRTVVNVLFLEELLHAAPRSLTKLIARDKTNVSTFDCTRKTP